MYLRGPNTLFDLDKVVCVVKSEKKFIYFEELKDGKFRMTYTENLIPDITNFDGLYIFK